jgi:serine protease inhibitor
MHPFHSRNGTDSPGVASAVGGNTRFALDLYRILRPTPGNLFLSPYSISVALAMTYAGARGETAAQMARTLGFDPDQKELHAAFAALEARLREVGKRGAVQLSVANRLWPHRKYAFLKDYLGLLRRFYGVRVTPVDYGDEEAARRTINAWVEEQTRHKIRDLIPPGVLTDLTRLVLANAIYFKGSWSSPFEVSLTSAAPFRVTPDQQAQVKMMARKTGFGYREFSGLQVLDLPYAGDDLSMIVLLPSEQDAPRGRDALAQLEDALTAENLERWTGNLIETEVQVFLPRFEVTFSVRLDGALVSLGMADVFSGQADFSGMDGSKELYIGAVLHKAFVVVNEEGTEAAAATAVIVFGLSMPRPAPVFRADHPFLFLICEKRTGSILFLGRVVNPVL